MPMNALQQALADVPVHAAMSQPMKCARADWTVRRLIGFFMEEGIYGAPVLGRNGEPVGVATARDIIGFEGLDRNELRALLHMKAMEGDAEDKLAGPDGRLEPGAGRPDENCSVAEIMTRTLIAVPRTASLLDVVRLMHQHHIHRVFVVDDGELVGVVSSSSLVKALVGTYVAE